MCIRDRSSVERTGTWEALGIRWSSDRFRDYLYRKHWAEVLRAVQGHGLDFLVPVRAVSYTHLDVYKRQE